MPDPAAQQPRFVFCATNTATGACWHFHGGPAARMADFYAEYWPARDVPVADAVAASSAFPPGFSALRLRVPRPGRDARLDPWGEVRPVSPKRGDQPHGHASGQVLLTDGGVYDNLGVEPVWDRAGSLLVSDAQRLFESAPGGSQWVVARLNRAVAIGLDQVAAVRRRWLVDQYLGGRRAGALWVLHSRPGDFPVTAGPGYGLGTQLLIHRVRTDLNAFGPGEQGCLENHGYWLADAAVRSYAPHMCSAPAAPFSWPDPDRATDAAAAVVLRENGSRALARDLWRYLSGR